MERRELLAGLNEQLAALDALAEGEALEELAAELEDAIFLLDCAEDEEEAAGALEEIAALAQELRALAQGDEEILEVARALTELAE